MKALRIVACLMLLLGNGTAAAHRASDAFLTLASRGSAIEGHWEIAIRDLQVAAGVDGDRDGRLTWGELRRQLPRLRTLLQSRLQLSADGDDCPLRVDRLMINDRLEGRFAWFRLAAQCPHPPSDLTIRYRLLFDVDPTHRGLVVLNRSGAAQTAVLSPDHREVRLSLTRASWLRTLVDYLREGIHHIWIGIDHILFLVSLLLPCVLWREDGRWQQAGHWSGVTRRVVGVVTAFTLAHSLTLALAALGILRFPARWTESAIALSVVVAALNNLRPIVTDRRWAVAFVFGLVHGFGFASVLGDLGLPTGMRTVALLAFNLGVEIGQLSIVALLLPILYLLRSSRLYPAAVLQGGSATIAVIAAWWFVERAFALG